MLPCKPTCVDKHRGSKLRAHDETGHIRKGLMQRFPGEMHGQPAESENSTTKLTAGTKKDLRSNSTRRCDESGIGRRMHCIDSSLLNSVAGARCSNFFNFKVEVLGRFQIAQSLSCQLCPSTKRNPPPSEWSSMSHTGNSESIRLPKLFVARRLSIRSPKTGNKFSRTAVKHRPHNRCCNALCLDWTLVKHDAHNTMRH